MPAMTLRNGARLNYGEAGSGLPLILVHGSPGEARAWGRVVRLLPANTRILVPDLPGYGGSDAILPGAIQRTQSMADAVGELIERCDGPVLLCGHSYGGNVALHAALSHREQIRELVLLEPVVMRALDLAGQRADRLDAQALFTTYLVRVEFGEPDAIGLVIDFWSGAGAYARIPMRQKHFLNALAATNAEDVRAAFSETITASQLTAFDRPVTIAVGGASPPTAGLISKALARFLPQANIVSIPGAAHAMLDTHPDHVASIIGQFCRSPVPVD
jgi:pimeloyl-ACP methyl ester carboxylesterase